MGRRAGAAPAGGSTGAAGAAVSPATATPATCVSEDITLNNTKVMANIAGKRAREISDWIRIVRKREEHTTFMRLLAEGDPLWSPDPPIVYP